MFSYNISWPLLNVQSTLVLGGTLTKIGLNYLKNTKIILILFPEIFVRSQCPKKEVIPTAKNSSVVQKNDVEM